MRDIGKNIKLLRVKRNMTQDELAEKLFVTRQTVSNYETGKSRPDIDMLENISQALEVDVYEVLYGLPRTPLKPDAGNLVIGGILTGVFAAACMILAPIAQRMYTNTYGFGILLAVEGLIEPLTWLCLGWTMALLMAMALKREPLKYRWVSVIRRGLVAVLILWFLISLVYTGATIVDDWLYANHIRGRWVEETYESNGETVVGKAWESLPLPLPEWLSRLGNQVVFWFNLQYPWLLFLYGAALWLCGFPKPTRSAEEI